MLRVKQNNTELLVIALHDIIRIICLKFSFNKAFSIVSNQSFCLSEGISNLNALKPRTFQPLADLLYKLDKEEKIVASCYSVALTIFYLAAIQNYDPYLVIGLDKIDEKLSGHAWVELPDGEIINPGKENISKMSIMHKWQVESGLEKWLSKAL